MREKFGKRSIGFFLVFFLRNRDLFSSTHQKSHNVAFGGCSNFTVRGGSARRAVRRYKFNDIFFAFDTSRYTYTTLLFILQRRSFLPLLLFYLEFLYFLLLLLLFAQPTLDVVSIESDIFFKLGRGG